MVEKQSMHPCQKAVIDSFELHKKHANLLENPSTTKEDLKRWGEEFLIKQEQIKQIAIANTCQDMNPEWLTPEFQKEAQAMIDAGF